MAAGSNLRPVIFRPAQDDRHGPGRPARTNVLVLRMRLMGQAADALIEHKEGGRPTNERHRSCWRPT
jgi:hypothetical protein